MFMKSCFNGAQCYVDIIIDVVNKYMKYTVCECGHIIYIRICISSWKAKPPGTVIYGLI